MLPCSDLRFKLCGLKVSATPSSSLPKRTREEEEDSTMEAADQVSDDTVEMPLPKKLKTVTPVGTEVCTIPPLCVITASAELRVSCQSWPMASSLRGSILYYLSNSWTVKLSWWWRYFAINSCLTVFAYIFFSWVSSHFHKKQKHKLNSTFMRKFSHWHSAFLLAMCF